MTSRGEDLARFRDQITPGSDSMPPRLFWAVMGFGYGGIFDQAIAMDNPWWQQALFILLMGTFFGLILNVAVWFAWSIIEPLVVEPIQTVIAKRRSREG